MQAVGYWEAWSLWWSGQKVDTMTMWGLPILAWARIGKLMQFLGGLIVIVDIIGPDRLRSAAKRVSKSGKEAQVTRKKMRFAPLYAAGSVFAWASNEFVIIPSLGDDYSTGGEVLSVLSIAALCLNIAVWSKEYLDKLVSPIVFVLSATQNGHPLRWTSFVIIAFGFHVDLLAS